LPLGKIFALFRLFKFPEFAPSESCNQISARSGGRETKHQSSV